MGLSKRQIFVLISVFVVSWVGLQLIRHPGMSALLPKRLANIHSGMSALFPKDVVDIHSRMNQALNISEVRNKTLSCPDVSTGMMRGRWKTRPTTPKERTEIETFLAYVRNRIGLPKSMQREDGRCGNTSYPYLRLMRALCNPNGSTPCCYNGRCVNKSPDDCHCSKCYDLRTQIHADYSTWEPKDPKCQVKNFTTKEACHLLQGTQVVVVGDSLMRHIYTALLLILSSDSYHGVLKPRISKDDYNRCGGMYIFTDIKCRTYIRRTESVCNNLTQIKILEYAHISQNERFLTLIDSLIIRPNTFVLVGIGPRDSFNRTVYEHYLLPTLQMLKAKRAIWPKIIWATVHKFGILKTPLIPEQEWESVHIFNNLMKDKLRHHNIPVFDTFNMTSGVMSPEGVHFGQGINVMKAQMFLNFFHELKRKRHW